MKPIVYSWALMLIALVGFSSEEGWLLDALNQRLRILGSIESAVVRTTAIGYTDSGFTTPEHQDNINYYYSGNQVKVEVARTSLGESSIPVYRNVYYLNHDRRTSFELLDRTGRTAKRDESSFSFWFHSPLMWPFAQLEYLKTGSNVKDFLLLDRLPESVKEFMPRGANYKFTKNEDQFTILFHSDLVEYASAVKIWAQSDAGEGFVLEKVHVLGYPSEEGKKSLDTRESFEIIESEKVQLNEDGSSITLPKIAVIIDYDVFTGAPVVYQRITVDSYEINLRLEDDVFEPDYTLVNKIYDADTGKTTEVEY